MTRPTLTPFFEARSVAVVGASADPSKVGGSVLANLRAAGFPGRIVPVNLRRRVVQGLPAIPSLREADDEVDLAAIAVPAPAVLEVLEDCAARGVRGAVVITAGFREAGEEGRQREDALRRWVASQPLRLVGPNCLGWMRPSRRLNLTFAAGSALPGTLGFFSHSGALCTAILDWSRDIGLGFSLFASLGNQADVTETDLLAALADDPETRVILGYLEGVADGARFFAALRDAAARKPCVLLKTGRTVEGARAVGSHTGALAGSDRAFDAAVRQAGAVRAATLEELFDVARALATGRRPPGRRVVLITNGGGLGILATDAARDEGLEVTPLDEAARERLAATLPPHAAVANPVDLIGDAPPARYDAALRALEGQAVSHVVMLAPQAATDAVGVARAVLGATRGWRTPVLAVFAGGARVRPGVAVLEEGGIPCYPFPERAVRALGRMVTLAERRPRPAPAALAVDRARVGRALAALAGGRRFGFLEAAPLLEAYGLRLLEARLARSPEEAARAAAAIGGFVALKIVSPDISHKTDVGGVALGVAGDQAEEVATSMLGRVRAAHPEARLEGIVVQRMAAPGGHELLLGMVRDSQFGPIVVVGAGGIYVEVLDDTATRLAPVDGEEALAMLGELRMAPALRGARGRPPADLHAVADAIRRFSQLAADTPSLEDLEINPLLVGPAGAFALDVRGRLEDPSP